MNKNNKVVPIGNSGVFVNFESVKQVCDVWGDGYNRLQDNPNIFICEHSDEANRSCITAENVFYALNNGNWFVSITDETPVDIYYDADDFVVDVVPRDHPQNKLAKNNKLDDQYDKYIDDLIQNIHSEVKEALAEAKKLQDERKNNDWCNANVWLESWKQLYIRYNDLYFKSLHEGKFNDAQWVNKLIRQKEGYEVLKCLRDMVSAGVTASHKDQVNNKA